MLLCAYDLSSSVFILFFLPHEIGVYDKKSISYFLYKISIWTIRYSISDPAALTRTLSLLSSFVVYVNVSILLRMYKIYNHTYIEPFKLKLHNIFSWPEQISWRVTVIKINCLFMKILLMGVWSTIMFAEKKFFMPVNLKMNYFNKRKKKIGFSPNFVTYDNVESINHKKH